MKRIQLISLMTCLNLTGVAFAANAADSGGSKPTYPEARSLRFPLIMALLQK